MKNRKVGIMSMQRVHNYGSFLQAYGLKSIVEKLGFEVEFIDYKFEKSLINQNDNKLKEKFKKIFKNINFCEYIKLKINLKKFNNIFEKEYLPILGINETKNFNNDLDYLIIGSDEVFNCMQEYPVGYSRNLFGKGFEKSKIISYAGSFGYTKYQDLIDHRIDKEISDFFYKFRAISVRDENSYDTVYKLTGIKSNLNLDPVLISNFPKSNVKIELKDYIIIYAYPRRFSKKEEKFIKKFAKKYNKKIVSLGIYQRIADENIIINPLEIFEYFRKADYVITDTFHGTIFSIKMNTNFCTLVRKSNRNKLSFLLKQLGQEERMIDNIQDIENLYNKKIDFTNTNKLIKSETDKSFEYLKENLLDG